MEEVIMDMDSSTFVHRLKCYRELNSRNKNFVNIDLYKLIVKEDALLAGYESIKSNKGATTPGIGTTSLDGFSRFRLEKLSKALRNESWIPAPARRIYIPKPGKTEKRPLGIQGPEEKIVQSTMLFVLEAIYEPVFYSSSFGFRPKLGTHDALKAIEQKYDGMVFAIEGDIKGMYDSVNHEILIRLLCKRIKDDRFIRLVRKMLSAGYLEVGKSLIRSDIGTPQGSIVSPILANIYMHELDAFMAEFVLDLPVRNGKLRTPLYAELDNEMRRIKHRLNKGNSSPQEKSNDLKRLNNLKVKSVGVRMYFDPSTRVFYTRYADDFIVGVAGSLEYANDLRSKIGEFLSTLNLSLNLEKSKVTNIRKSHALFLGHMIRIDTAVKYRYVRPKGKARYLKRVTGRLVSIEAPILRMVLRLSAKGFCDHKGFPIAKTLWTSQDDNQIIENYNATVRGIFGYYSGANKRQYLQRIWYILRFSCAYTLATKHRCSLSKVFIKHGRLLRVIYGPSGEFQVSLYEPPLKEKDRKWQVGRKFDDPYRLIAARMSRTKLFEDCCICGAASSEMHHIRHVKDSKPGFVLRIMGLLNRKQIPVCVECHDSIHSGRYDGLALRDLFNPGVASR
jgi:group II intron reverse transcriptase/maturase